MNKKGKNKITNLSKYLNTSGKNERIDGEVA